MADDFSQMESRVQSIDTYVTRCLKEHIAEEDEDIEAARNTMQYLLARKGK